MTTTNQPTDTEIRQAAEVIKRLPRGFLPFELFIAIASKVTTPTMEVVPVRNRDGALEVLLTKRPADDPHWPNCWHLTGTVILATDNAGPNFSSGVQRVLEDELHGTIKPIGEIVYIGIEFWDVARGRELDHIFYFETNATDENVKEGRFFNVNELPESILEHHKVVVQKIVEAFRTKEE